MVVQGPNYSYYNNQVETYVETYVDLDQGSRGASEEKWSDFKFILKKIIGFADGLEMG